MLGASYPFADVMWTMLVFFLWVLWFWLLFTVFADVFRRHDISGWVKTLWIIFVIIVPFLGVFIYLIVESKGMAQRNIDRANEAKSQFDSYVRQTAGSGSAGEIAQAKELLDSGAITQAEFDSLKAKALA
jgi:hypothetical protein